MGLATGISRHRIELFLPGGDGDFTESVLFDLGLNEQCALISK